MLAVSVFSKSMPIDFVARVLGVLGILCAAYILFMLATSNPFDRIVPLPPADGADLNSALQDFGFIIHPPTLYMGYVGFSVVFAFAIAALLSGRLDAAWARWSRPWANVAWAILTIGIALGSWWAYYELGWGGWWAWGSGGESTSDYLAVWYRTDSFSGGDREKRHIQELDCIAGYPGFFGQPAGDVYYPFRFADLGACLCQ